MCLLGHPSPWVKSWGQPPGLLQGLLTVKDKCLYPQNSGSYLQQREQLLFLEHSPLHSPPSAGMVCLCFQPLGLQQLVLL